MNKAEIRSRIKERKLKEQVVFIEDWGCEIKVTELTGKRLVQLTERAMEKNKLNQRKFYTLAIIDSVFTLEGEKVFSNDDFEMVENLPGTVYSDLMGVIVKLNNIAGDSNPKNLEKTI